MSKRRDKDAEKEPLATAVDPMIRVKMTTPPREVAAAITEPKPVAPRKPRRPVPQDVKLSARQYCRARGHRWERCAGFLLDMKRKHPGDKTRPEWDQLWGAFWSRPVR